MKKSLMIVGFSTALSVFCIINTAMASGFDYKKPCIQEVHGSWLDRALSRAQECNSQQWYLRQKYLKGSV